MRVRVRVTWESTLTVEVPDDDDYLYEYISDAIGYEPPENLEFLDWGIIG